jgi:hypothetical protein
MNAKHWCVDQEASAQVSVLAPDLRIGTRYTRQLD